MARLLFKATFDFADTRTKDTPLLMAPKALIVGIEDGNNAEILDSAYLIQYPFINGFGFVKGEYFKLSSSFNLLLFEVQSLSKFRLLPLRKQPKLTVSIWEAPPMPLSPDFNPLSSSTTGTTASITAATTSTALLAANPNRKAMSIYNNSVATLYIGFGATVTTTLFSHKIGPNTLWEMPSDYDGPVVGVWSAASGNALVTEFV